MSFPRRRARSRRFSLGRPRSIQVRPGGRVLFLRSRSAEDPTTDLWVLDGTGERRLASGSTGEHELPAEERARRERVREMAEGIVAYSVDRVGRRVAYALDGRLWAVDVDGGEPEALPARIGAFDPRVSPDGSQLAYVAAGELRRICSDGEDRVVAAEPEVAWGIADHAAAEEMDRVRGFWWSPDGGSLAACRVDEREVPIWHIVDQAHPERAPQAIRYPVAGAHNADVQLWILAVDDDERVQVVWDRERFPYLARVRWDDGAPLTLLVQSRDQQTWQVLTVDPGSGRTTVVREDRDDRWLTLVPGAPVWTDAGELVVVVDLRGDDEHGTRALVVGDDVVTPAGLQVWEVLAVDGRTVWFTAEETPFDRAVFRLELGDGELQRVSPSEGVHDAVVGSDAVVLVSTTIAHLPVAEVRPRDGAPRRLEQHHLDPLVDPQPEFVSLGERRLSAAVLRPSQGGDGSLPVLLSPYGGPGPHPRVRRSRSLFLEAQWLADQGFVVLVTDNRGMPGKGPGFEKAIRSDLAGPALEDQIAALDALAEIEPRADLDRVGIRGWSFGGFLSALAVLRRPDRFRAAIAGAPVTDWRLYDTHYTERYLGLPDEHPDAYRRSSLVDAAGELVDPAPLDGREPPALMLIHGLADDNVVAAHALRLSSALLAGGRPHTFLPLSGVTHMTPQEVVAENLLELQVRFLRDALT